MEILLRILLRHGWLYSDISLAFGPFQFWYPMIVAHTQQEIRKIIGGLCVVSMLFSGCSGSYTKGDTKYLSVASNVVLSIVSDGSSSNATGDTYDLSAASKLARCYSLMIVAHTQRGIPTISQRSSHHFSVIYRIQRYKRFVETNDLSAAFSVLQCYFIITVVQMFRRD